MKTNARQNTGKNVKISSKGFAIPTEKSIAKRVPMGPKIGSIIQLPARPFGRPTATPL